MSFVQPERRRVGLVPQEAALFPHLDVAGNVGFGIGRRRAALHGWPSCSSSWACRATASAAPTSCLGESRRAWRSARALAPEPEVVLLDEPFAALDAALRAEIREDVRAVLLATGATGVLVTHDQEEALSIADHVAVMRSGQVVQVAPPVDLYSAPVDLEVARFRRRGG